MASNPYFPGMSLGVVPVSGPGGGSTTMQPPPNLTYLPVGWQATLGQGTSPTANWQKASQLPYAENLYSDMEYLQRAIEELMTTQAPEYLLSGALNGARQEAYSRGLDGPLAAAVAANARTNALNQWNQQKFGRLQEMVALSGNLALTTQQQEWQRRMAEYARKLAAAQAEAGKNADIGAMIGTGAGGALGGYFGGPAGAGAGANIGGGIGSAVGGGL